MTVLLRSPEQCFSVTRVGHVEWWISKSSGSYEVMSLGGRKRDSEGGGGRIGRWGKRALC